MFSGNLGVRSYGKTRSNFGRLSGIDPRVLFHRWLTWPARTKLKLTSPEGGAKGRECVPEGTWGNFQTVCVCEFACRHARKISSTRLIFPICRLMLLNTARALFPARDGHSEQRERAASRHATPHSVSTSKYRPRRRYSERNGRAPRHPSLRRPRTSRFPR